VIIFDANGGNVSHTDRSTDEVGKLDFLPVPQKPNHTFNGWFTHPQGGSEVSTEFIFDSDEIIYAQWTEHEQPAQTDVVRVPDDRVNLAMVNPPLAGGIIADFSVGGLLLFAPFGAQAWSMVNLILALLGIIFMLAAVARAVFQKKREFKDDDNYLNYSEEISLDNKKKVMWLPVAFVGAILSIFLFLVMQDRTAPMVLTDFWTLAHIILFVTEVTSVVLAFKKGKKAVSAMREIEQNAMAIM